MPRIEGFAPAKVNLALHVLGQRADGYHLLDSLVAFADFGDRLQVEEADALALEVTGPMAAGVPADRGNLVWRAAELLDPARGAAITLEKHLPMAAGIGGGSSDAAATLRALCDLWGLPLPGTAMTLGADVPMCLDAVTARISGAGEGRRAVTGLPSLPAVLVNPRVEVATPAVYAGLDRKDNAAMPDELPRLGSVAAVAAWLSGQRNDLMAPALALAPPIGAALDALGDAALARMSGSGATCFGLYENRADAEAAAARIAKSEPDWWVQAVTLNPS